MTAEATNMNTMIQTLPVFPEHKTTREHYLESDQVTKLSKILEKDDTSKALACLVDLKTGLRYAELLGLTPDSIATLLNKLTGNTTGYYYEPTAGTGGILITRWWQDCLNDPVGTKNNTNIPGISFFTYDPRKYWYQVEELSDRAVPFLIFNMAIRGMNGVAIQCDSLSREAKNAYFIRNNTDNALTFSEVIEVPKTKDFEKELNINWKEV